MSNPALLTWIEPFFGAASCVDRKWSLNETFAMCSTVGIGIWFLLYASIVSLKSFSGHLSFADLI